MDYSLDLLSDSLETGYKGGILVLKELTVIFSDALCVTYAIGFFFRKKVCFWMKNDKH